MVDTVHIPESERQSPANRLAFRNGLYPDAAAQSFLAEETNRILSSRTKCVASFFNSLDTGTSSSTDLWWFAFHSSSHIQYLKVVMYAFGSGSLTLTVKNLAGTTIGTAVYDCGESNSDGGEVSLPTLLVEDDGVPVELTGNTDYYCYFTTSTCFPVAACVYEQALPADVANGYVETGSTALGPVNSGDLGDIIPLLRTAWKRNASHLWSWAYFSTTGAPSSTSSSFVNVIDTSFAPNTGGPSVQLLQDRCSTVRRSPDVPARMFVFAKMSSLASGNGSVALFEDGSQIATADISSTTATWFEANDVFALDSGAGVHEMAMKTNGGGRTITVYAFCLISYEE